MREAKRWAERLPGGRIRPQCRAAQGGVRATDLTVSGNRAKFPSHGSVLARRGKLRPTLRGRRANALSNGLPLLGLRGLAGVADCGDVWRGGSPRVEDSFFSCS